VLGANHGVEVFLGDSIREFKAKVTLACEKERQFWKDKGVSFDDKMKKYADITVAYKHLVMIFVPTPKVQQLYAQGLYKGSEYKHAYTVALSDPSSWQPMEPTRTFNQYPQYHFDVKTPQQIRILEATDSYKLLNLRYKEFDNEMNKKPFEDLDTSDQSYGYAKYKHPGDGYSEWRPAVVSAHAQDDKDKEGNPKLGYKVNWCFKPFVPVERDATGKAIDTDSKDDPGMDCKAEDVMLAPRIPLIAFNFDPAHVEVLGQATTMRSLGNSDWDIEAYLNQQLTKEWMRKTKELTKGSPTIRKPPKISVEIIRSYITRQNTLAFQGERDRPGGEAMNNEARSSSRA